MPKVDTVEKVCPECGCGEFNQIDEPYWDYECQKCLFYWTEDEVTNQKAEQIPSKVQEYKNLEKTEDGKPVWAFVCPDKNCQHENKMKGHPSKFINRPFRCLKCNYVPLLGKEGIEEFVEDSSFSKPVSKEEPQDS